MFVCLFFVSHKNFQLWECGKSFFSIYHSVEMIPLTFLTNGSCGPLHILQDFSTLWNGMKTVCIMKLNKWSIRKNRQNFAMFSLSVHCFHVHWTGKCPWPVRFLLLWKEHPGNDLLVFAFWSFWMSFCSLGNKFLWWRLPNYPLVCRLQWFFFISYINLL